MSNNFAIENVLTSPMSEEAAVAMQRATGNVTGVVLLDLQENMYGLHQDLEIILSDMLTEAVLSDIDFRVVGFTEDGKSLYIEVSGTINQDWYKNASIDLGL